MHYRFSAIDRYGRGVSMTLTAPNGTTLDIPAPVQFLECEVAAVPLAHVSDDLHVTFDLTRWTLRDLPMQRETGLTVTGDPHSDQVSRIVHRYASEARSLPHYALDEWRQRVVADEA